MARNVSKDLLEEERRRQQILNAGFELFSQNGIDSVRLSDIAKKADVGIATLYKYYTNKSNLVISISANIWKKKWISSVQQFSMDYFYSCTAYQLIEIYINGVIDIFIHEPSILRFSSHYKDYINSVGATDEQLEVQMEVLDPMRELFHQKYEEAKCIGDIRTDISEMELYTTFTITSLSIAERYAVGIVWQNQENKEYVKQLNYLKNMLLNWCKKSNNGEEKI